MRWVGGGEVGGESTFGKSAVFWGGMPVIEITNHCDVGILSRGLLQLLEAPFDFRQFDQTLGPVGWFETGFEMHCHKPKVRAAINCPETR